MVGDYAEINCVCGCVLHISIFVSQGTTVNQSHNVSCQSCVSILAVAAAAAAAAAAFIIII